jgi:hypothetical protein
MPNCFACDKFYEHHVPSALIKPEYCSLECQQEFELELETEITHAKTSGIIDSEGNAIISAQPTQKAHDISVQKLADLLRPQNK